MIQDNPQESRKGWMLPAFYRAGVDNQKNDYHLFWENGSHPTALWSDDVIWQKIEYIHNNPVRAGFVNEPFEYLYSSANPLSPLKVDEM
jgi:putative transposase